MRTVQQFPFPAEVAAGERFQLEMPEGAIIRHFAVLLSGSIMGPREHPIIWAEVDTDAPVVVRHFIIVATGMPLERAGAYVAIYPKGKETWHLYEQRSDEWTEWEGGDCPVLGFMVVDYRERNGIEHTAPAAALIWAHGGDGGDIVAYRISAEQPEQ